MATTKNPGNRDLNSIAQNLRRSNQGIKLGRALFDPQYQGQISSQQIANVLKEIGLPLGSAESRVTLASAQILISGGVFADNVSHAASLQSFVAPVKAVLDSAIEILDALGLMSKKDPAAKGVNFLGSATLVMATGGLNVLADIAFVMDIVGLLFQQDTPVDMVKLRNDLLLQSAESLKKKLITRITNEANAASQLFGDYHSGSISVFQMLGGVAQTAPDLFLKFFPDFEAFIPYTTDNVCETTSKVVYNERSAGSNADLEKIYANIDSGGWPWLDIVQFPYGVYAFEGFQDGFGSYNAFGKYYPVTYDMVTGDFFGVKKQLDEVYYKIPQGAKFISPQQYGQINQTRQGYIEARSSNTDPRRFETISETFCHEVQTIRQYRKAELQEIFLRKYVADPFEPYRFLASMTREKLRTYGYPPSSGLVPHPNPIFPRIPIGTLALLSSLPPYFSRLDETFDLTKTLVATGLTPNDLGFENFGETYLQYSEVSSYEEPVHSGVTFNGVDYWTKGDSSYNKAVSKNNYDIKRAVKLDNAGYMAEFSKIPNAQRVLKEFGTMPWLPPDIEAKMFSAREPAQRDYRNIQNYWAAISVMDAIRKDNYFQDAKGLSLYKELDGQFPSASEFEAEHKRLQFLMVGKKLNEEAKKNIAFFFGETDYRKLRFKPMKQGEVAGVLPPPITVRGK